MSASQIETVREVTDTIAEYLAVIDKVYNGVNGDHRKAIEPSTGKLNV